MGTSPTYGWPWPEYGTAPPDGPDAFQDLAVAMEATYEGAVLSYTPAWTVSGGTVQPSAPASINGKYQVRDGYCDLVVFISFGASTNGGNGNTRISLPVPPLGSGVVQYLPAKIHVATIFRGFIGAAQILPGDSLMRLYFPTSASNVAVTEMRSMDTSNAVGTGRPTISGAHTVQNGGNLCIQGRYEVA